MVQKLEAIKDSSGSIRVGTTGTIGSLMTRELESMKGAPKSPVSSSRRTPTVPVSVPCGSTTTKRLQPRTSSNGASSSGGNGSDCNTNQRVPDDNQKTRTNIQKTAHRIPMLNSENIMLDKTPNREKCKKKGSYIVEVVDLKCGNPDKPWSTPITNRLKKLSFSKLSESVV